MIKDFFVAIKMYSKALFLIKKLHLWKYFLIPAFISLVLGILLSLSIYCLSNDIGFSIARFYPFSFGKEIITSAGTILGGLIILGIGIVLYKHIVMALSAPFMAPLSEKVEEHLTGVDCKMPSMKESLVRGIRINIRNLFFELCIVIPCTILAFIPVIGIVFTLISFLTQSYYAGFGNMDYTLERHLKYQHSINFVKQNRFTAIGNGVLYTLVLLIPFVGIIFILPISTVAATISTLEKLNVDPKKLYV